MKLKGLLRTILILFGIILVVNVIVLSFFVNYNIGFVASAFLGLFY